MSTFNGPWADEKPLNTNCVVTSALNGENVESDGAHPHSDAEVNHLRALSGDTQGGESLHAGDRALRLAYGRAPHLVADTRAKIAAAFVAGNWVEAIGMIGALPKRLQSQTKSVAHAVLFGPAGEIVDPEDTSNAGHPGTRSITPVERDNFLLSGGYDGLVFVPHRYAPHHWQAAIGAGSFSVWKLHGTKWKEGHRGTKRPVVRRCKPPVLVQGVGLLVELTEGVNKGYSVKVGGSISAAEVLGA